MAVSMHSPGQNPLRPWYRRRVWQLLLLLLVSFSAWLLWRAHQSNQLHALIARIETNHNCTVGYLPPDWSLKLNRLTWLPDSFRMWLLDKTRYTVLLELENQLNRQVEDDLLEAIARQPWPDLESLSYTDIPVFQGNRQLIPEYCPKLTNLQLGNSELNDASIELLVKRFPRLVLLKLSDQPLEGHGLSQLAHLKNLETLHLNGSKLRTLDFLHGMHQVKSLNFSNTTIKDSMLDALRHCRNLQLLSLSHTEITGTNLKALKDCSKLQQLELHSTLITDYGLNSLPLFDQLEILDLSHTSISGESLFSQGVPSHLKDLFLMNTQVELKHLQKLENHPRLGRIFLDQSTTKDDDCPWLGSLPNLYYLTLTNTKVGDRFMKSISTLQELNHLDLKKTAITDASAPSLRRLVTLFTLDISETNAGNACIQALIKHMKLQKLSMESTRVNDEAVPFLLQIPNLNVISTSQGQFSDACIQKLRARGIHVNIDEERDSRK